LHEQIKHLKTKNFSKMHELIEKKEVQGELTEKDEKSLKELRRQAEDEILKNADVICTTCVAACDRRIRNFRFRQVLIDEATQATEPETLIPILKGAKHIILVGDHC
jgi:regulator of nonsense transcripts 1